MVEEGTWWWSLPGSLAKTSSGIVVGQSLPLNPAADSIVALYMWVQLGLGLGLALALDPIL